MRFEIRGNGRISGLWTVGYHGVVEHNETPARQDPLLVDVRGHLVRVLGEDGGYVVGDAADTPADLAGIVASKLGTVVPMMPAMLGWAWTVCGTMEYHNAIPILAELDPSSLQFDAVTLLSRRPGGLLAQWYWSEHTHASLVQAIRRVAKNETRRHAWWWYRAGGPEPARRCDDE